MSMSITAKFFDNTKIQTEGRARTNIALQAFFPVQIQGFLLAHPRSVISIGYPNAGQRFE